MKVKGAQNKMRQNRRMNERKWRTCQLFVVAKFSNWFKLFLLACCFVFFSSSLFVVIGLFGAIHSLQLLSLTFSLFLSLSLFVFLLAMLAKNGWEHKKDVVKYSRIHISLSVSLSISPSLVPFVVVVVDGHSIFNYLATKKRPTKKAIYFCCCCCCCCFFMLKLSNNWIEAAHAQTCLSKQANHAFHVCLCAWHQCATTTTTIVT